MGLVRHGPAIVLKFFLSFVGYEKDIIYKNEVMLIENWRNWMLKKINFWRKHSQRKSTVRRGFTTPLEQRRKVCLRVEAPVKNNIRYWLHPDKSPQENPQHSVNWLCKRRIHSETLRRKHVTGKATWRLNVKTFVLIVDFLAWIFYVLDHFVAVLIDQLWGFELLRRTHLIGFTVYLFVGWDESPLLYLIFISYLWNVACSDISAS